MSELVHLLDRGTVASGLPAAAYCGEWRSVWRHPEQVGATTWCAACDLEDELRRANRAASLDQSSVLR